MLKVRKSKVGEFQLILKGEELFLTLDPGDSEKVLGKPVKGEMILLKEIWKLKEKSKEN